MSASTTIIGNLTRDPELRFTTSGRAAASFGLASTRRYRDGSDGEWKEVVSFFNVTAWGQLGESLCESLRKGHRVLVTGRLEQRRWESPEGDKRSTVELVAEDVGASVLFAQLRIAKVEREPAESDRPLAAVGDSEPAASKAS